MRPTGAVLVLAWAGMFAALLLLVVHGVQIVTGADTTPTTTTTTIATSVGSARNQPALPVRPGLPAIPALEDSPVSPEHQGHQGSVDCRVNQDCRVLGDRSEQQVRRGRPDRRVHQGRIRWCPDRKANGLQGPPGIECPEGFTLGPVRVQDELRDGDEVTLFVCVAGG